LVHEIATLDAHKHAIVYLIVVSREVAAVVLGYKSAVEGIGKPPDKLFVVDFRQCARQAGRVFGNVALLYII
jgi:hypothetical protein